MVTPFIRISPNVRSSPQQTFGALDPNLDF